MLLATVATRTFPRFLISLAILIIAASPAAAQVQSRLASIQLTATVPAMLSITGASVLSRETSGGYEVITTRVLVRGNVSHRLEVRAVNAHESEVRVARGQWARVSGDRSMSVARTDMIGETSHLVTCRTAAPRLTSAAGESGCALTFAIASTDPQFPGQSASLLATR